jgi:transcription elongation factor
LADQTTTAIVAAMMIRNIGMVIAGLALSPADSAGFTAAAGDGAEVAAAGGDTGAAGSETPGWAVRDAADCGASAKAWDPTDRTSNSAMNSIFIDSPS